MRKLTTSIVLGSFVLAGCANKEDMAKYYDIQQQRTAAIIKSIEAQASANRAQRSQEMSFFSNATVAATRTADPTDDALIAFAWGYRMGQPMDIEMPQLPHLEAPPTNVDYVRAWTPLAAMAVPFLYPLAYGWGGDSASKISASDQATINIESGNAGAYNSRNAGTISGVAYQEQDDLYIGDGAENVSPQTRAGAATTSDEEAEQLPSEGGTAPEGCTDAVYQGGVWWYDANAGLSCESAGF